MSKYVDLITARMSCDQRRTGKVPTALDPKLWDEWEAAREAVAAAKLDAATEQGEYLTGKAKPTAAVKAAEKAEENARAALRDASVYAHYRSLTSTEMAAAGSGIDPESPAAELHKALIVAAFVHATPIDSDEPIADLTAEVYAQHVASMGVGELNAHWAKVQALAAQTVDFPTLLR